MQRVGFQVSSVRRFRRKEVQVQVRSWRGTGLEDVMLRGSVQSGRFEASGKVLEGSEPGSASWL